VCCKEGKKTDMDFDWQTFLQQWSRKILKEPDHCLPVNMSLPVEVIQRQWLGYSGATYLEVVVNEGGRMVSSTTSRVDRGISRWLYRRY
jgi:hypothetical protein